jgi:hypothetical protein
MGEARRRSQNAKRSAAGGAADDIPLPTDQADFLQGLSAWNDAHAWEPPPAEQSPVPASEVMVYLVDTSNLWNVVGGAWPSPCARGSRGRRDRPGPAACSEA